MVECYSFIGPMEWYQNGVQICCFFGLDVQAT